MAGGFFTGGAIFGGVVGGVELYSKTGLNETSKITNVKNKINSDNINIISGRNSYIEGELNTNNDINLLAGFKVDDNGILSETGKGGSIVISSSADTFLQNVSTNKSKVNTSLKNPFMKIGLRGEYNTNTTSTTNQTLSETTLNANNININAVDNIITKGIGLNASNINMTTINGNVNIKDYILNNEETNTNAKATIKTDFYLHRFITNPRSIGEINNNKDDMLDLAKVLVKNEIVRDLTIFGGGNYNLTQQEISKGTKINSNNLNINSGNDFIVKGSKINSKNANIKTDGDVILKSSTNKTLNINGNVGFKDDLKPSVINNNLIIGDNILDITLNANANYNITNNFSELNVDNLNINSRDSLIIACGTINTDNADIKVKNHTIMTAVYDQNYNANLDSKIKFRTEELNVENHSRNILNGELNTNDLIDDLLKTTDTDINSNINISENLSSKSSSINANNLNLSTDKTTTILSSDINVKNDANIDAGYLLTMVALPDKINGKENIKANISRDKNNNLNLSVEGNISLNTKGYNGSSINVGGNLDGKVDYGIINFNSDLDNKKFKSDVIPELIDKIPDERLREIARDKIPNFLPIVIDYNYNKDLIDFKDSFKGGFKYESDLKTITLEPGGYKINIPKMLDKLMNIENTLNNGINFINDNFGTDIEKETEISDVVNKIGKVIGY